MSVEWNGKEAFRIFNDASEDALRIAGLLVLNSVVPNLNVDTGRHRASQSVALSFEGPARQKTEVKEFINSETKHKQMSTSEDGVEKPRALPGELIAVIGSNVEYSIYRELDKPALMMALENNAKPIEKLFNRNL